jgi:hypothetical protein
VALRPTVFDANVPALDKASFAQSLEERGHRNAATYDALWPGE